MINLTTSVHDRATPVVLTISAHANPAALKRIVGESAVRIFVRHLRAVDRAKPNAIGGKRTHFYADAARQTSYAEVSDGVVVSINKLGLRQRVVGGTIRKKSKWLTIPAHPDAHGKRASQFGKLEVIFNHEGRPVALARPGTIGQITTTNTGKSRKIKTKARFGEILFWLKTQVTQRPDPSVVPTIFDLAAGVRSSVNQVLDRAVARARAEGIRREANKSNAGQAGQFS